MNKILLTKYFSGNATPEEEAQIIDWAEASPDNYRQYLNERKLWDALVVNTSTTASTTSNKPLLIWKAIGIAASLALILLLSWEQFQRQEKIILSQTITVPAGQRVHLLLEDSTSIWLNANSTLTYPTSFSNKKREVFLDGEGFFEVKPRSNSPFVVKTTLYNINVTGTSFNIYAYKNEEVHFETALYSGSLYITNPNDNAAPLLLQPNEKVTAVNGKLVKSAITNQEHSRWREGLICMDDMPFDVLMKKFAIYYDITIKIENPNLNNYLCTGKFRQSDGIDYALRVIQKDLNFTFERSGTEENTIITIR